jgi:ribonuclease R
MLPRLISEDKLSLLENQTRFTITFSITLSRDLEISKKEIRKTYLKNRRRLNYALVDYILESSPDDPDYQFLNDCYVIARRLLDKRRQNGALVIFDLQRMLFTNEEGLLIKLNPEDAHKSYIIIQEFMILANAAVAELAAENEYLFLFRNHTARQTTPDRNEIIEQLKTAAVQPKQLNSLIKRSELWFNKAKYEQKLAGHYGLNLPAYTHITSPLRRAADLVNHNLLKSQLWDQQIEFSKEELQSISSEINSLLLKQAAEKKEIFKEQSRKQTQTKITIGNSDSLIKLGNNEFKKILKEICRNGALTKDFEDALLARFNENKIGVDQIAILLFETKNIDESWKHIRAKALETSLTAASYSLQLLHYLEQTGVLNNLQIDVKEDQSHFFARIVASLENKPLSTPKYSFGNNKKDARNASANEFLKHYIEKTLNAETETAEPELPVFNLLSENIIPDDEIPIENYVGQLMEFCMNNSQTMPEFEFSQEGVSHSPAFTCICKLKTNDQIFNTAAVSKNKKASKQLAAKKMIDEIENLSLNMLAEKGIGWLKNDDTEEIEENYIGLLNDKCIKLSLPMPKYEFAGSGPSHQPVFIYKVSIKLADKLLTATASAPNKKKAKQLTAKEILKNLDAVE